jgi:hypothetical protein
MNVLIKSYPRLPTDGLLSLSREIGEPSEAFFNPEYGRGNEIREIEETAALIEKKVGIRPVRAHLGNPTANTPAQANKLVADYFLHRDAAVSYDPHQGHPPLREQAVRLVEMLLDLPPNCLDYTHATSVAGNTQGLNLGMAIFDKWGYKGPVVFPEPFYFPWLALSRQHGRQVITCPLREEDGWLSNYTLLRNILLKCDRNRAVIILINPNLNPIGNALSEKEAQEEGLIYSKLAEEFPNAFFLEESIYIGTIRKDLGIFLPSQFMNGEALARTAILISTSKMGLAPDRAGLAVPLSKTMAKYFRGASGSNNMGNGRAALIGGVEILRDIVTGGLKPYHGGRKAPGYNPDCVRYWTADFYQERLAALAGPLQHLEKSPRVDELILPHGVPPSTYYLWANLPVKDLPVPATMRAAARKHGVNLPEVVRTADDVQTLVTNAWAFGYRPLTLAPGKLFTRNTESIRARLAAVESPQDLRDAATTLAYVIGSVRGADLRWLGVRPRSVAELRDAYPPPPPETSPEPRRIGRTG